MRVAFAAALPYDLGAYLNPFQHSQWQADEPFDRLCAEITAAIDHRAGLPPKVPQHIFDTQSLDRLSKELAIYIGPVARVLVARAAKNAPDWTHLYDALAREIPQEQERKLFLAKRVASS